MSTVFRAVHPIRFSHCDPGGIVYFPHFFDFITATVEDWSDEAIETPFETHLLEKRLGLPVVTTRCEFFRPSRIGDRLELQLSIARLGRSTIDFHITGSAGGEKRLRARHVIAMVSLEDHRAVPIPDTLRSRISPYVLDMPPLERLSENRTAVPKVFRSRHLLRFSHCDPAGVLYFPNTFDMINASVEDWFAEALHLPFEELHIQTRLGFPIVDTRCEFIKPSRIGEQLTIELAVARLGRASVALQMSGIVAGEERMRVRHVIAMVSLETMRAVPIPADLRARMAQYTAEPADSAL